LHAKPQTPPVQTAWPCATPVVQAWPQPLQLFASVVASVHVEPHCVVPPEHADAQWAVLPDATQIGVEPEQTVPQAPQLLVCIRLDSQPSVGSPLQSPYPGAHALAPNEHWPAVHDVDPLTFGRFVQSRLHEPHRAGTVSASLQPLPVALQSANPEAHW
jgi:hypothetical protein